MESKKTVEYWDNGKIRCEMWRNEKGQYHREGGLPSLTWWFESGNKEHESYRVNGKRHRLDGPALTWWYKSGKKECESYRVNGKYLTKEDWENHPLVQGYWADKAINKEVFDEKVPEWVKKNPEPQTFLIAIAQWHQGQDHTQLTEFKDNAGFRFILKAQGQKDIEITQDNFGGTCSQGDGRFQVFDVRMNDSQYSQIQRHLTYKLEPVNDSDEYFWTVNDDVALTVPNSSRTFDILSSTVYPDRITIAGDIRGIIRLLERIAETIEIPGQTEKIKFVLLVEPEQLRRLPKINFSAEGLTLIELLWIACNRSALEYRIEGTTVYIDKKDG